MIEVTQMAEAGHHGGSSVAISAWWLLTHALGYFGAALVGYSLVASVTQPWEPVERYAPGTSSFLTIIGVLVTAASIYFPVRTDHRPWRVSLWLIAPLVITACLAAAYVGLRSGSLPPVLVNGLALLGLSGGLQRIVPVSVRDITNLKD